MTPEQREFLNLRDKPGIVGFLESDYMTGIRVDGLMYLEKVDHFKALANPPPGAQRYFLTSYVMKVARDEKWMAKAVRLIREYSRRRNQARKKLQAKEGGTNGKRINGFTTRG
jgi:hypothetical protein